MKINYKIDVFGRFISVLLALVTIASCSSGSEEKVTPQPPTPPPVQEVTNQERINELWPATIAQLSTETLWSDRDKYDASHMLLQPMQYAFATEDQDKIADFEAFFTQLDIYFEEAETGNDRVATTQFMFVVSEYLVMQHQRGKVDALSISLYAKLVNWLTEFMNSPAWMWGRDPFSTLVERTEWKLNTQVVDYSYYRAMFDEDLHSFAVLANLAYLDRNSSLTANSEFTSLSQSTMPLIEQMLRQEVSYTGDADSNGNKAWVFQAGAWSQHPDFAHAGQAQLADDLPESQIADIATDSSHMHRWPVWLKAYQRGFDSNAEMNSYIAQLQAGFTYQFNEKVYVAADENFTTPRLNNFFDGRNGVYRYNYVTAGNNSGYGPYQLSAIVYVGWYGNLEQSDAFVKDIKALIAKDMNLTENELDTYVGPNTSRERNALFVWPSYFTNQMGELNIRVTLHMLEN